MTENKHYKISVVIPVYKVEDYLHRCVDSVLNQTMEDLEIILVDDGSPDNCPKICDDYAAEHENIFAFHKVNGGLSSARNVGIKNAHGKYLFFLDSDDYLYTSEFNKVVDSILADQNILQAKHMRNDGKVFFPGVHRGDFLKKEFVGNLKHQDMRCHEDSDFKVKLRKLPGYKIDKIDNIIYHYNEPRIGSLTWEDRKKRKIQGYDKGIDEWEKIYGK